MSAIVASEPNPIPGQIRDAQPADLPRIVEIYNAAIPGRMATADTEPVSVESRQAWFAAHNPQHRPLWVLERDGQILGWIGLQDFYGRPAYRATCEISLYIDPAHQHQGIGQTLLRTLIQHCPQLGITTLLGFIFSHNHPSLNLLQKHGFQQWGHLPKIAQLDSHPKDLSILGLKIP